METKHSFKDNFYKWIKNTSYEEYMRNVSNGLGIDVAIPIEGVDTSLGLNSSTTKETYERIQKAIEENTIRNISEEDAKRIVISNTNEQVYKAWSDCMQSMISGCIVDPPPPPGTLHVKSIKRKGNEIYITLESLLYPGDPEVVVEKFHVPTTLKCITGCLKNGDRIKGEHTIILQRVTEGDGTLIIDTSRNTLEIPIVHATLDTARKAGERLVHFITDRLGKSDYILPKELKGVWSGPVIVELRLNGELVEFNIKIPSSIDNVEVAEFGGSQYIYHPDPNKYYFVPLVNDSGKYFEFFIGADEICNVIKSTIEMLSPSPLT
ncbi:hypothetical protein [Paenibacillus sp. AGC30]